MYAWVAGSSSASRSPWATSSSTHMIAGPPASETTATRSPCGIGCKAKAIARSKSSSIEFARRTPVCENTASAARSEPPREPVWDTAARLPQRDPARERRRRGERRIHADVGVGVDHAHAVRPDHRHVIRVAHREESRLSGDSRLADFTEAGSDHDEPFHSLLPAVLDGFECDLCGYRDDREIHSVGNLEDARVRADPMDARRLRIHRVDRPLVLVHNEVVEDFVPDFSTMTRCADDCDGRRREDRVESAAGHRGANPSARLEGSRLVRFAGCYPVPKSLSRGITAPFE